MSPRVQLLIPLYQAGETVQETLDSLRSQSFSSWEALFIDDGSTDEGPARIAAIARIDPRIRLLRAPHEGLVAALERGRAALDHAVPLVARLDADDRCHPERLARQVAFLDAHPEVAVVDSRVSMFRSEGELGEGMRRYQRWLDSLEDHRSIMDALLVESPMVHPAVMLRAEWLEAVGGYRDGDFPEDYDLWLRLARRGARFHKLPERLLEWRDSAGRATRADTRYRRQAFDRLRLQHLLETRQLIPGRTRLVVWGAGRGGRWWRRSLHELGAVPRYLIDISQRLLGRRLRGVEVRAPAGLRPDEVDLLLVAVGAVGARERIRRALQEAGMPPERVVFVA